MRVVVIPASLTEIPLGASDAPLPAARRRIHTAAITTLGCRLNQAESYAARIQLARAGVDVVPFGEPADLSIVNTCTVTHAADQEARQVLRRAKRISPHGIVVAMGCYAQVAPDEVRAVEGVDAVIVSRKDELVSQLEAMGFRLGATDDEEPAGNGGPDQGLVLPSTRVRQFVKVQDGCDDYCTYCIVPFARGHALSRPADAVVAEVQELVARGCREVVLTGVQIGAYGRDRYRERRWRASSPAAGVDGEGMAPSPRVGEGVRALSDLPAPGTPLAALVRRLLDETAVDRVRISSIQPQDWSPDFLDLFDDSRLCRHLHLPLQSGSDDVLRRMSRRYTTADFAALVDRLRARLPDIAITADIIVGFPGESDAQHNESLAFVRRMAFADAHVFRYSPRRGTAASHMAGQLPPEVKRDRSEAMRSVVRETAAAFRLQFLGTVRPVLWEEELGPTQDGGRRWSGLTDNYLRVRTAHDGDLLGTTSFVVLHDSGDGDLIGRPSEAARAAEARR